MRIKILGNGGALNDGLPYNSFMVDDYLLAEAPPDIMNSLFREKTDLSKIRIIYISHYHGDHYFGLPFLLLRLFFDFTASPFDYRIQIAGPENIKGKTKEICSLALGETHPVNKWIDGFITFIDLGPGSTINMKDDTCLKTFSMNHFTETYGFSLRINDKSVFAYFADTLWSDELLSEIKLFPRVILADLNGEPSDPVKVHMSEEDIVKNALPVSGDRIVYYGTHLKRQKWSALGQIKYVQPGDLINPD